MSEGGDAKRDIRDEDLFDTMTAFYAIIAVDPLLVRYFEHVDMSIHMPRIVAFWSTLLFHTRSYSGNAFKPHLEMPGLAGEHFAFWVGTLERVVDERFAGPTASLMKELAHRIGYGMQVRLGIPPFELFRPSI
ncbi:MAG: group III truncated hemoglobin [Gemmatimonadaceae bacterium]